MTSRRSRLRTGVAVLAALGLLLAACGDGGEATEDSAQDAEGSDEGPDAGADEPAEGEPDSEDEEAFYAGRSLELLVPFGPGGGTDTTARFLAPFLGDFVEGEPTVQVRNVEGGGSINGANEFATRSERDGSVGLFVANSTVLPWLLGDPAVQYDLSEMEPIIGFPTSRIVYVSPDTMVETPGDLANPPTELVMGGRGPTQADLLTILALEALGVRDNIQQVFGYESGGAQALAFEQGETNVDHMTSVAYIDNVTDLEAAGDAIPLFTFGLPDENGELGPDPAFPDLPTARDAYIEIHGEEPSGQAWDAFMTYMSVVGQSTFGFLMHDDAPPEAVAALRDGMERAAASDEFAEQAEAVFGPYQPVTGAALEAYVETLRTLDQENLDFVRNLLEEEYDVVIE